VSFQDHFSAQAAAYAVARPKYPASLYAELARLAPGRNLAWDAGTGNGQAAVGLAAHFARVVATEPSEAQLAQASAHPGVEYHRSAETAPMLADGSVDLVTVAQAAHWFDRPVFYAEVRRVLRPGGVVAMWVYELCNVRPDIDALLKYFYRGPIWSSWPPERRHVETGYRDFDFPFHELPFPSVVMQCDWTLGDFVAYLRTWSSVVRFTRENGLDPVIALEAELAPLWGHGVRRVVWPLSGRIGLQPG
jgi:SAM-dependent methyltransferase